jgi:lantibiotic modifying enzyme
MFTDLHSKPLKVSRRVFLQTSALGLAVGTPLVSVGGTVNLKAPVGSNKKDLLDGAQEAGRWIRSAQKDSAQGRYWLPEPDHPEKATTVSPINGVYSGSAGIVLFFLQLAKATGDSTYLEDAKRGADYLVETWPDLSTAKQRLPGTNLSLYNGLSGVAFVLTETWKTTGDSRYRTAALLATQTLANAAKPAGSGVAWSESPGIIADGSVILHLLYAARAFEREDYRNLAAAGGRRLLELAEPQSPAGIRWKGVPPSLLGLPEETYFPNFELGTAGIAYVLARLYEETGEPRFLEGAKQGAIHLQQIATVRGAGALIPYRYPNLHDVYYLGFCHGPAGTARLFYQLYKVTQDKAYLEWTETLARGVMNSGIPANQTPGFWNVICQCCGSAGVTEFFLGLWASTGNSEYYAFANDLADQALSRQTNFDGKGSRWYQAWTRVKPWEVTAETGYSIGAAGVGTALLHAFLAQSGRYDTIALPDNPFAGRRDENAKVQSATVDFNNLDQFPP